MNGVRIGPDAIIRRAIIDKNVDLPAGAQVGVDLEADRKRGFTITDSGLVVIPMIADAGSLFGR